MKIINEKDIRNIWRNFKLRMSLDHMKCKKIFLTFGCKIIWDLINIMSITNPHYRLGKYWTMISLAIEVSISIFKSLQG